MLAQSAPARRAATRAARGQTLYQVSCGEAPARRARKASAMSGRSVVSWSTGRRSQISSSAGVFGTQTPSLSARDAVSEAGSRLADVAGRTSESAGELIDRASPRVAAAAEDAGNRAERLMRTAHESPVLLALAGIAAGVAVARSVRGTETGDRLGRRGSDRTRCPAGGRRGEPSR